jgi:hypothetical protein
MRVELIRAAVAPVSRRPAVATLVGSHLISILVGAVSDWNSIDRRTALVKRDGLRGSAIILEARGVKVGVHVVPGKPAGCVVSEIEVVVNDVYRGSRIVKAISAVVVRQQRTANCDYTLNVCDAAAAKRRGVVIKSTESNGDGSPQSGDSASEGQKDAQSVVAKERAVDDRQAAGVADGTPFSTLVSFEGAADHRQIPRVGDGTPCCLFAIDSNVSCEGAINDIEPCSDTIRTRPSIEDCASRAEEAGVA